MGSNESQAEASPLPFLYLIQTLKHIPRTAWSMKVENSESVAGHSFRLAFLGLLAPVGSHPFLRGPLDSNPLVAPTGFQRVHVHRFVS